MTATPSSSGEKLIDTGGHPPLVGPDGRSLDNQHAPLNTATDSAASEIGRLFTEGKADTTVADKHIVAAVLKHLECGALLNRKKERVDHGQWSEWLRANCDILGFAPQGENQAKNTERTAQRLMKAAKTYPSPASDMGVEEAIEISRELWGHNKYSRYRGLTGDIEWMTPLHVAEAARRAMGGIDIDPASNPVVNSEVIKAKKFYTQENDGLEHDWPGMVYVNAPFAHPTVKHFAYHLISQYTSGITTEAIWLSNHCSNLEWWRALARRGVICLAGKLSFGKVRGDEVKYLPGKSQFEQSIIYLGPNPDRFYEEFSDIGVVVRPVPSADNCAEARPT